MYVCEFEIVRAEGVVECWPFWPGRIDGTQGASFDDAVDMAADWLNEVVLDQMMKGEEVPELPKGNAPSRGGTIVAVAVNPSLDQIPSVTASEAATLLGVTSARVAQLCKAGALDSWKVGRTRMVSRESVNLRLKDACRPGRPKRDPALV